MRSESKEPQWNTKRGRDIMLLMYGRDDNVRMHTLGVSAAQAIINMTLERALTTGQGRLGGHCSSQPERQRPGRPLPARGCCLNAVSAYLKASAATQC
jgi:hypothetical protein